MKHLVAPKHNNNDWSMRFVDDTDYDTLYNEDVFVRKENGDPLLVLLKRKLDLHIVAGAWSVLKNWKPVTENRSVASGIEAKPRKKLDGTYSNVTRVPKGWEVISGIIGYFERTVRMPYAHACAWNLQNPEKFQRILPMVQAVSDIYRETVPERWNAQKAICDRTPKDWIIGESVFTTLTVNKNFRTSCHLDAGDLPDGFSCMTVIEDGKYLGANLVLPNYRIAANVRQGDVILFDPHCFHGNTQFLPITPKAQRCSIVYYYRDKLQLCKPMAEELEFAKNKKYGEALY